MDLVYRPKNEYLHQASVETLHRMTMVWLSEIAFWGDELRFLQDLIDRYFVRMVAEENISVTEDLVDRITHYRDKELKQLEADVGKHDKHLQELIENAFSHDEQAFREEHRKLEERISGFINEVKALKIDVFDLAESIIEEDRARHLLNP